MSMRFLGGDWCIAVLRPIVRRRSAQLSIAGPAERGSFDFYFKVVPAAAKE
jgi:hypothetical protein